MFTLKRLILDVRLIPAWVCILSALVCLYIFYDFTGLLNETKMQLPSMEAKIRSVEYESLNKIKDIAIQLHAGRIQQFELIRFELGIIIFLLFCLACYVLYFVLKISRFQSELDESRSNSDLTKQRH